MQFNRKYCFYPPGSKSEALRLGVHLILLYFIGSHLQPRRLLFYLGGGRWPTFWFFKSLDKQPLRGRLHKAAARPQRRGERPGALKFKEIHPSAGPRRR